MKHKMKRATKVILVEAVIFFLLIGGLFLFTPKILGVEREDKLTFFKFSNAYAILIDDNPEFTSPEKINDKAMKLNPGKYYWKAIGLLGESETGDFNIDSEVIISVDIEDKTLKNEGNVPINVDKKTGGVISGNMIIEINEKKQFGNELNVTFEASQNN